MSSKLIFVGLAIAFAVLALNAVHLSVSHQGEPEAQDTNLLTAVTCPTDLIVSLDYTGKRMSDQEVIQVLDEYVNTCSIWKDIRGITLGFRLNQVTTFAVFQKAIAAIRDLRYLSIELEFNNVTESGSQELKNLIASAPLLGGLKLYLNSNNVKSTKFLDGTLKTYTELTILYIDLSNNQLSEADGFNTLLDVGNIVNFVTINLSNNYITNAVPVAAMLSIVDNLQFLTLSLNNNVISSISLFSNVFQNMKDLAQVYINFGYNRIQIIDALATMFEKNTNIDQLILNFWSNQIVDISAVALAFQNLKSLTTLNLYLVSNQIISAKPFQNAFKNLNAIENFSLEISVNRINQGIQEVANALLYDIGNRKAFCPFQFVVNYNPISTADKKILANTKKDLETLKTGVQCPYGSGFVFSY